MNTTRRSFLQTGAFAGSVLQAAGAPPKRPNILFIQTDDQRFDDASCLGNTVLQTPNLDRIAVQGIRFNNAFVTTSICCCSRASVLTGQHMWRHGIRDFETPLTAAQLDSTYPVLLRSAGYRTGFLGKYAIGTARDSVVDEQGRAPGAAKPSLSLPSDRFDFWFGFPQAIDFLQRQGGRPQHLTHLVTERAIEFLRAGSPERPFCLSINFKEPHGPWNYFEPDLPDVYRDADVPAPPTFTREDFERLPEFVRKSLNGNRTGLWPETARQQFLQEARTSYRLVSGVDRAVGRILASLRELKLDDNTVIIFTSDNGSMRGAHGLAGKWLMYEESIRVPLIIRDPRLPAESQGTRRTQMALNIDVAPTILSLAGVRTPSTIQGRDLTPVLANQDQRWREEWFYEHTYSTDDGRLPIARTEGVRTTRWKYTRYIDSQPLYEELFDLESDPLERNNLAGNAKFKEQFSALRVRWRELRREVD